MNAASDWWGPDINGSAAICKDDSVERDKENVSQLAHVSWWAPSYWHRLQAGHKNLKITKNQHFLIDLQTHKHQTRSVLCLQRNLSFANYVVIADPNTDIKYRPQKQTILFLGNQELTKTRRKKTGI